jgi:hypothetical protein
VLPRLGNGEGAEGGDFRTRFRTMTIEIVRCGLVVDVGFSWLVF